MDNRFEETENISVQDIAIGRSFGMSDDEILGIDYFQTKRNLENKFSDMIWAWYKGNKPEITQEEAEELDNKYEDICRKWESTLSDDFPIGCDPLVRFRSIPENDYSVVFYMGYPFDCELCKWAEQMVK